MNLCDLYGKSQLLMPISMPPHFQQTISSDKPLSDLAFDPSNGNLWILGKNSLWLWEVSQDKLSRINIDESFDKQSLETIFLDSENSIWIANARSLYKVVLKNQKVNNYETSKASGSLAIQANEKGQIFWTKRDGVYMLDQTQQHPELTLQLSFDAFQQKALKIQHISQHRNWLATDFAVFSLPTINKLRGPRRLKPRLIYRSPHKITALIEEQDKDVSVVSNQTIVRVSRWGDIKQIIPVRAQRKLTYTSHQSHFHRYLFTDGLIEEYDLNKKSKNSFFIEPSIGEATISAISAKNILATLTPDAAHLFFLDGR